MAEYMNLILHSVVLLACFERRTEADGKSTLNSTNYLYDVWQVDSGSHLT